jgi:serine protease Do
VTAAIAQVRESAVALEYTAADAPSGARRVASGVVVGHDGELLSVRIDPPSAAAPIVARVASGRRLPAQWLASDPETGLTLLKIEPGTARPAAPSSKGARLGVPVLVIGNPFGLAQSVSRGFIAGLGRRLELGPRQLGGLIQVDAALHPGDSGALVADLHGGWVGVIRSGLAAPDRATDDHDLGFAIPAADALWVAGQLRDRGRVDRAFLGVTMDRAAVGPEATSGAVLGRVLADSPAETAGLKAGDRVVAIDGKPVRSPFDLTDRLDRTPADAEITLDLVRNDAPPLQVSRLTLRASRRPPFEPSRPAPAPSREKSRPDDSRPNRALIETVERLERRIRDLEKEKEAAAQARRP